MKKKDYLFALLVTAAAILILLGFVWYAAASVPFQDLEYVPANTLTKQACDLLWGKVLILLGAVLFCGALILRHIASRNNKQ